MKSLVEFMTKDPLLCAGKFNQNFTHKTAQKKWEMITAELNTLPGAEKSWDKWKKVKIFVYCKYPIAPLIINTIKTVLIDVQITLISYIHTKKYR